jgi:hypothetical protein
MERGREESVWRNGDESGSGSGNGSGKGSGGGNSRHVYKFTSIGLLVGFPSTYVCFHSSALSLSTRITYLLVPMLVL